MMKDRPSASPETIVKTGLDAVEHSVLSTVFDARLPIAIDIGCGNGRFLVARASREPGVMFLGIERQLSRVRRVERRIRQAGLVNARLLHCNAAQAISERLPPGRIRTCYILFPDPWPKRRHHKRRLLNDDFIASLWRCLEPGGRVFLSSDQGDYIAAAHTRFLAHGRFREVEPCLREEEEQTGFERIFRSQGITIHERGFQALLP